MSRVLLPWSQGLLPANAAVTRRVEAAWPQLSAALQTFAIFALREPMLICSESITRVAEVAGVSVASANRLARALGYDSYAEFRRELAQDVTPLQNPVDNLRRHVSVGGPVSAAMQASLQEDITNLEESIRSIDPGRCAQAASLISGARQVMMVGFDNAAALGALFAHRLAGLGCDTRLPDYGGGALTVSRQIAQLGPQDLVVAIAFPRYLRDTVTMAKFAHERGVPVLAITDGPMSPLADLSRVALYTLARRSFSITSDAAILAMLEALAAGVARVKPGAVEAAQRIADLGDFWSTR